MRGDDARAEVVDRDFHRRMAASLLPERIHPSGRRGAPDKGPRRNGGALEKPGRERPVSAVDPYRTRAAVSIPEKTGDRATMTHTPDPQLLERPIRILVVGCGGNGSAIVSGLPY